MHKCRLLSDQKEYIKGILDEGVYPNFSDFSETQRYTSDLKKLAQPFQVAIRFHPDHPQLKTLTDSSNAPV